MRYFAGIIFIVLFVSLISATFNIGEKSHLINKRYSQEDNIRGWINISLDDEPANSKFEDSLGNSISLIELLKKDSYDYSCDIPYCDSNYIEGSLIEGSMTLNEGDSKLIGFKFDEDFQSITSASFNIESDAEASCTNQLKIDFLSDKNFDFVNEKASSLSCDNPREYGCFRSDETLLEASLGNLPYCQRIKLSEAPGFEVGAWVKKKGSGNETLKMSLYDSEGNSLSKSCVLPDASINGSEISCNINYSTESAYYYVCILSEQGNKGYSIRGHSEINGCGYNQFPDLSKEENYAYQIFANSKKFDSLGEVKITIPQNIIEDYLQEGYSGFNCSEGCIVPVRLFSQTNQSVLIKNVSIEYNLGGGLSKKINSLYELDEIPSKVNMDFQKIYLDKGEFKLPSEYGEITFSLDLDEKEIFSEKISIENIILIKGLTPTKTVSAYPTKFRITGNPDGNVSKYVWDFGNWDSQTTSIKEAVHTYNSTGEYILKITATDSEGFSFSKTFNITVGSPKNITKEIIDEKLSDIENIILQIKSFDEFSKKSLESSLEIDLINSKLKELQIQYERASSVEEYNSILTELLQIDVPKNVRIPRSAEEISFYPEKSVLNLEVLKSIGGGDYDADKKDSYKQAIADWHQINIESKLNFKEFSAEYQNYEEPILRIFELEISEKESISESPYLIIEKMGNLKFKDNYLEEEVSGYFSIILEQSKQTISFSTTEDVDFINLPLFISPKIDRLDLKNYQLDEPSDFRWMLFILVIFLILIVGVAVYIILQEWYKRKYEAYLFKSRNQLYNLFVYIENSKKKGIENKVITSKLKKAGWNSEQVAYVIKKYAGKKTGMFELPVERILNKFKREENKNNLIKKV